jgi:hypothetical protein
MTPADIEVGVKAVSELPKIPGVSLPENPFLDATAIHTEGGAGPDGTFCLQGWAAKLFGGKLKKDYSMKGKEASFIVDRLNESATVFMSASGECKWWEKGIGFITAYTLSDRPDIIAEIWNLTMNRFTGEDL